MASKIKKKISSSTTFSIQVDISKTPVAPTLPPSKTYLVSKRILDILGSSIFLIGTAPLCGLIIILIKIHSPGPAIFKQKRVGFKGKHFVMYKFRTMHLSAPAYEKCPKDAHDPRINAPGKFLRKTSLDELPQFWNVLKGNMSLVGPRPEMPFIVDLYAPWERKRLDAKPGITGLWQISGRKNRPLSENPEFDLEYVRTQSFWVDIKILLKTIPAVIFRHGAY